MISHAIVAIQSAEVCAASSCCTLPIPRFQYSIISSTGRDWGEIPAGRRAAGTLEPAYKVADGPGSLATRGPARHTLFILSQSDDGGLDGCRTPRIQGCPFRAFTR